jgi:hypothetical protein
LRVSGGAEAQSLGGTVLVDQEAPPHWQPIIEMPIVVVVGVTGVGKSTTIEHLTRRLPFFVLPDRRDLADRVVIPAVQDELGLPRAPVRDRVERFRMTARYRERNPGGMAYALARLRVDPAALGGHLIFDGLRGVDEVHWAIEHLPRSRFLGLRAPESVRLLRLLGRHEKFDFAEVRSAALATAERDVESLLRAVEGLDGVISREELAAVLSTSALEGVPLDEIASKAAILVEESRNYDPAATLRMLEAELGPWRHLIVNTAVHSPEQVADQVARWLR